MINIDVNAVPKLFNMCVKDDCPLAEKCLRHEVGVAVMENGANWIRILNLRALNKNMDGECEFFKPTEKEIHGKGLLKFLESLPIAESRKAQSAIEAAVSSGRQFYRYRNGEKTIDPQLQDLMRAKLKKAGIENDLFFDEMVDIYSF